MLADVNALRELTRWRQDGRTGTSHCSEFGVQLSSAKGYSTLGDVGPAKMIVLNIRGNPEGKTQIIRNKGLSGAFPYGIVHMTKSSSFKPPAE